MPLCPRWCSGLTPCSQCQMERLKPAPAAQRIPPVYPVVGRKIRGHATDRFKITSARSLAGDKYVK